MLAKLKLNKDEISKFELMKSKIKYNKLNKVSNKKIGVVVAIFVQFSTLLGKRRQHSLLFEQANNVPQKRTLAQLLCGLL